MAPTAHADTEHILVVVGSLNQDHFVYLPEFPLPGQTVFATDGSTSIGGKGANQAIAAALLGTSVTLIGRVGGDSAGDSARATLAAFGVDTAQLIVHEGAQTGAAFITVNAAGENTIVVNSGANSVADTEATDDALDAVLAERGPAGMTILMQGELPAAVVDRTAAFAARHGIRFILNLAPAIEVRRETLAVSSPLILNEGEARDVLLQLKHPLSESAASDRYAILLADSLGSSVIVTLGAAGAAVADGSNAWLQPASLVDHVVDTTGAGDAFVGALASALVEGRELGEAVRRGVTAGSLAVRAAGTTASYPNRESLDAAADLDGARR